MSMPRQTTIHRYRSIFISDFHMGAKAFDAPALLDFLRSTESGYLYLVGDIIDGWKLNKRWYWTADCNAVLDELARKAAEGTKVIYIPGNHDETVRFASKRKRRRFARRHNITICDKFVHQTTDNKRILILHGDQFDRQIIRGTLSRLSDRIYDWLLDLIDGHAAPHIRIKGKIKKFSLAKSLSRPGKWALYLLNNFESAIYRMARQHGADGLICGHTHIPALKSIRGLLYGNCGAWLRTGHTALVETAEGKIELLDWPGTHEPYEQPGLFTEAALPAYRLLPDATRYRPVTEAIVRTIQKTWPEQPKPSGAPHHWIELGDNRTTATLTLPGGLITHKIGVKPDKSGEFIRDKISGYAGHIIAKTALGRKFLPETRIVEIITELERNAAGNIDPAMRAQR